MSLIVLENAKKSYISGEVKVPALKGISLSIDGSCTDGFNTCSRKAVRVGSKVCQLPRRSRQEAAGIPAASRIYGWLRSAPIACQLEPLTCSGVRGTIGQSNRPRLRSSGLAPYKRPRR